MASEAPGMSFKVRDFGPIGRGRITLRPLTIFLGPGSSGKSYAAMAIHSILKSHPNDMYFRGLFWRYRPSPRIKPDMAIMKMLLNLQEMRQAEVPKSLTNKILRDIVSQVYAVNVGREMSKMFGAEIASLVRKGAGHFEIDVDYGGNGIRMGIKNGRPKSVPSSYGLRLKAKVGGKHRTYGLAWKSGTECTIELGRIFTRGMRDRHLLDAIGEACMVYLTRNVPDKSHYLPAVRSGIIQSHKAITQSIVQHATYAGVKDIQVEKMPGQFADLISNLLEFDSRPSGDYAEITSDFERELVKGRIMVRNPGKVSVPDIRYEADGYSIPLHLASSTISELATLFLYMKYIVRRDDLVIIEEPEAHLHPASQDVLARFVVRLIRNGLRVLVTTHSPYFVYVINTSILESEVPGNSHGGGFLRPDEVALHLFKRTRKGSHVIRQVPAQGGIPGDEFSDVDARLYEEKMAVVDRIGGKSGRGRQDS